MNRQLLIAALLALLLAPVTVLAQDTSYIDFGVAGVSGSVDARTGPGQVAFSNGFQPDIINSGVNVYQDNRNTLLIRRAEIERTIGNNGGFFNLRAASNGFAFSGDTLRRDQALLATAGQYGVYKVQFRWDNTPHLFSGTTRSLYTQASPGVYRFTGNRAPLDAARVAGTGAALASAVNSQIGGVALDVQRNLRKTLAGLASWDITPDWNAMVSFARENQEGTRPHGVCFGNNPSCFWAEVGEPLEYATDTFQASTELGRNLWDVQLGYWRQGFHNDVTSMTVDNPFSNNANATNVAATGQMGLYPNNQAQNVDFSGAVNTGRFHFVTSVSPGWQTQNDPFVPYTTNAFLLGRTGAQAPIPLPVASLDGRHQTLAANLTATFNVAKNVDVTARYRQYDHHNNTEERVFTPWVNDLEAEAQLTTPGGSGQETKEFGGLRGVLADCAGVCTEPFAFGTKNIELDGVWFFAKKSSVKAEYGREVFDREHRDVSRTVEDTVKLAVDLKPTSDLTLRVTGSHGNREPRDNEYEWFLLPGTQRPDEGFRSRNRADLLAQYDLTSRVSVSGFYDIRHDDFNRRSSLTSLTPLGDPSLVVSTTARPTPSLGPYYVYGVLEDQTWNAGGDVDVLLADSLTVFAEYSHDRNQNRMVSRQRSANTASQVGCPSATNLADCDPINDWTTLARDRVDTWSVGTDLGVRKKVDVSLYYSLSSAKGNLLTDGVNCQVGNGPSSYCRSNFPNWRLDTAANQAVTFNFPDTSSKLHELDAIARFRLTNNIVPKFQYRFQRFEYSDFQTSVMNPYSYVGPAADPAGTTGLQRMLFLGADTPGYRAHVFVFSLEYHF